MVQTTRSLRLPLVYKELGMLLLSLIVLQLVVVQSARSLGWKTKEALMMTQLSRVDPKSMCHLRSTPSLVSAVREEVEEWDVAVVAAEEEWGIQGRGTSQGAFGFSLEDTILWSISLLQFRVPNLRFISSSSLPCIFLAGTKKTKNIRMTTSTFIKIDVN